MKSKKGLSIMNFALSIGIFIFFILLFYAIKSPNAEASNNTQAVNVSVKSSQEEDYKMAFVSLTEYVPSEPFEIIVRLMNYQGEVIPNATCNVSIAYPNQSIFIDNQAMTFSSPFQNHYYQGIIPDGIGVYEILANCTKNSRSYADSKTFHVSNLSTTLTTHLNLTAYNITSYLQNQFNSTNNTIINNFASQNITLENHTSALQQIISDLNLLLFPCNGNTTLTITGLNRTRIGEIFYIRASILDNCQHSLTNFTCTANTGTFWGSLSMPYNSGISQYEYISIANKSGTVSWQVTCT